MVLVKIIIRDRISIKSHKVCDESLIALNCYYESDFFYIKKNHSLDKMFDCVLEKIAPFVSHMKCDHMQLIVA